MRRPVVLGATLVPLALPLAGPPSPASAASLHPVAVAHGAIDAAGYGLADYPAPCLTVASSGRAHVLVGDRALERVRGGRFTASRFIVGDQHPCGYGYDADGDLIGSYSRFLYNDYRDGDVFDIGYELLRPGSSSGPRVSTSRNGTEGEQPEGVPLLPDAGGAVVVLRSFYAGAEAIVLRAHGTQRTSLRLRWSRPKPWYVASIAASGSRSGGTAAIVELVHESSKGPNPYRYVVATRGRAGAFTRATTLRRGPLSATRIAVTGRGTVLAALQRPDARIELASGTVRQRVRRRGPAIPGTRAVLAADEERGLLAYETCPRRGPCTVRTRTVSADGVPGPPSPVVARIPRGEAVRVRTDAGGRALVWWTAGRHLRVAVRGPGGRFARPVTVTSEVRSGARVVWGRGGEVLAAWTARRQQVAVALRVR